MKRKLMSLALALVMILSLLPASAFAVEPDAGTDTGTTAVTHAGTEADPYVIKATLNAETGETKENGFFAPDGSLWLNTGYYRLETDVSVETLGTLNGDEVVTVDLNNHTVTGTGGGADTKYSAVYFDFAQLTLTGTGTVKFDPAPAEGMSAVNITAGAGTLTIDSGVTVVAAEGAYGIGFVETSGTPTLNLKGKITGAGSGVAVNGNITDKSVKVNLDNASIDVGCHGIYQAGNGNTTDMIVKNSTVKGGVTGIEVRAGSLTLTNSTVTGGSSNLFVKPNGSGSTTENAAVAVAQHVTEQPITVTLQGKTTLTGNAALSISNPQKNPQASGAAPVPVNVTINGGTYNGTITVDTETAYKVPDNTKLNITGGTFDADVSDYVEAGKYECNGIDGGKYVVEPYIAPAKVTFTLPTGVGLDASKMTNLAASTGDLKVYSVTDKTLPATFALTLPENTQVTSVMLGETALDADENGVYTIPANQTADVTVKVTTETTVADATLTVAVPNDTEAASIQSTVGKAVSDLQKELAVDGLKVTGTSNYVKEFTWFSNKTEDQQGNYIALKLETDATGTPIQYMSADGDADGYKTVDTDGLLIWKITVDKDSSSIKPIHVKIGKAEYDIDLSELTLGLPAMPEASGSVTENKIENDLTANADTKKQVESDIKNTIANASTGNADSESSESVEATRTEVTISFSAATNDATSGGTVKLDSTAVAALQNKGTEATAKTVTVNATVETKVATVTLPAGALEQLDSNETVAVSATKVAADDAKRNITDEGQKGLLTDQTPIVAVDVTQGTNTKPFAGTTLKDDSAITIRIPVAAAGTYQALYIDTTSLKKVGGEVTVTADNLFVELKVGHLSDYAVVPVNDTTKTTLAALESEATTDHPVKVMAAPLVDRKTQNPLTGKDLSDGYGIMNGTLVQPETPITLTPDANGRVAVTVVGQIAKHQNGAGNDGLWAGIGILANDSAKAAAGWTMEQVATADKAITDASVRDSFVVISDGDNAGTYHTFYFGVDKAAGKTTGFIKVIDNEVTTVYMIDFSGVTELVKKVTVTFNGNKPSEATTAEVSGVPAAQEIAKGGKITVPAAPTLTGYTFKGWAETADGAVIDDLANKTFDANATLYAVWEVTAADTVDVTFTLPTGFSLKDSEGNAIALTGNKCSATKDAEFKFKLEGTVPSGQKAVVKIGGEAIEADANGVYTIPAAKLSTDIAVTVTLEAVTGKTPAATTAADVSVAVGETKTFTVTTDGTITVTSATPAVATVVKTGEPTNNAQTYTITGVTAGTSVVTISATAGDTYDALAEKTITVTVTAAASGDDTVTTDDNKITIDNAGAEAGETVSVTVTPEAGKKVSAVTVTYTYTDPTTQVTEQKTMAATYDAATGKWSFQVPANATNLKVSATYEDTPAQAIKVTAVKGGLFGSQIKIENLDASKYYIVQLTKKVKGTESSVALKLSGEATQVVNTLTGAYTVEIWVCATDSSNLADYGNRIVNVSVTANA